MPCREGKETGLKNAGNSRVCRINQSFVLVMGNLADPQKTTDRDSVLKFTLYISLGLVRYLIYSHEMGMRKV